MLREIFYLSLMFLGFIFNVQSHESIIFRGKPHGMFSVFHFVLYFLQEFEMGNISGLEINFSDKGVYFDQKKGLNWWEYYFEPILLKKENQNTKERIIEEMEYIDINRVEFATSIEDKNLLINKYIKTKPHITNKVNKFKDTHFKDHYVIGVHYRGTDKNRREAERVDYNKVIEEIKKVIDNLSAKDNYKIFVATDEFLFLYYLLYRFGAKVCYCQAERSLDNTPIHHSDEPRDRYKMGMEAIIDALLLSECNHLIRTSSNLSLCSRYFNPRLPTTELSQRNPEDVPCPCFCQ